MSYLETTAKFYTEAAKTPQIGLCCISTPPLQFPDLHISEIMQQMNYGCGTTIQPTELRNNPTVLYIGVGGGLEALQFAYFCRRKGSVIAIDPVEAMREVARQNLQLAAKDNDWFDLEFVNILEGDAFALPVPDASVDVVAQNCLFNIFEPQDLQRALKEVYRVLKPQGRLIMSDPIATSSIPANLQADERLRAMCLSGAMTYDQYIHYLVEVGFGQIEVRARRPYRLLDTHSFDLDKPLMLESLDSVSFKVPIPSDGACVFTGKTAVYSGSAEYLDDRAGHLLQRGNPLAVCDKTATKLADKFPYEVIITDSTWHYNGGGCC